jgi:hypothetical protein
MIIGVRQCGLRSVECGMVRSGEQDPAVVHALRVMGGVAAPGRVVPHRLAEAPPGPVVIQWQRSLRPRSGPGRQLYQPVLRLPRVILPPARREIAAGGVGELGQGGTCPSQRCDLGGAIRAGAAVGRSHRRGVVVFASHGSHQRRIGKMETRDVANAWVIWCARDCIAGNRTWRMRPQLCPAPLQESGRGRRTP